MSKFEACAAEDLREDLDDAGDVGPTVVEEAGADVEQPDLTIVVSQEQDIETGLEEVSQFNHDAEDLNRLGTLVDTRAQSTGGLTPVEAEVVQCAVESLYRRLGLKATKTLAAESFTDTKKLKLATESIGEALKKAWSAIVEFLKKMFGMVKEFFVGLFDAVKRIENRALRLKNKAKELRDAGAKPVGDSMRPRGWWRDLVQMSLMSPDLPANANAVAVSLTNANHAFNEAAKDTISLLEKAGKSIQEVAHGNKTPEEAGVDLNFLAKYRYKLAVDKNNNNEYVLSKDMPGSRNVVIHFPQGDTGQQRAAFMNLGLFGGISVRTNNSMEGMERVLNGVYKLKASTTVGIADPEEAIDVCDCVLELAATIGRSKKFSQDVLGEMNQAIAMADKASKQFEDTWKNSSVSLRKAILAYGKVGALVMTKLSSIAVSAANGGLGYVRQSLSHNQVIPKS